MKIKEINIINRPREKLIKNGVNTLSNEELLAILLGVGNKEESAWELSTKIINSVSELSDLSNFTFQELIKIKGIKDSKACIILSCFELVKRVYSFKDIKIKYDNPKEIFALMQPILSLEKVEVFYALYLNPKCQIIEKRLINRGTSSNVTFDIKEVLKHGIKNSCYGIILIHNHPSGDVRPSKSDLKYTSDFQMAGKLLNIMLLDHIIIGKDDYYSFIEMNILVK